MDQRQEGARSIRGWKSLQVNSWQQELGKEQRLLTEREKHKLIASAQIYGVDKDSTDSEDKEETMEDEPGDPEPTWKVPELIKHAYSKIIEASHKWRGRRPSRPGLTSTGPGEKSRRPTAGPEGRGGHPKGGSPTPSWAGLGRGGDLAKTCGEVSRPSTSGIRIRAKGSQRWKESGPEVGSYRVGGERQLGK